MTSSLSSTARRLLAGAALACAAACAAGCASTTTTTAGGAASTGAGSSASASASAASQSPAGGGVTVTATPGGANANAAGPQSCATRSLSAKLGNGQGAAGSTYVDIVFTNIGSASCTLYGYPGVALTGGASNTVIGLTAARDTSATKTLVTLAPGAQGSALLRIVDAGNFPSSSCDPVSAAYLQVIPPNQTTPMYIAYKVQTCSKSEQILTIGTVQSGANAQ